MRESKRITKHGKMQVSNLVIDTIKKDIKNMHLGVYPPNGRVRVAVPLKTSDDTIRLFILSKMTWIKKQQLKFDNQEREISKDYTVGESHYFFGKRYRLRINYVKTAQKIEIKKINYIDLYIKPDSTVQQREVIFDRFYRSELTKLIPSLLEKWQKKIDLDVSEIKIKKMKTKWGTCNPQHKRIWLNLELAKKPVNDIEYVIVHEMIHLIEKHHSPRFIQILQSNMPQWKKYKEELNKQPLKFLEL